MALTDFLVSGTYTIANINRYDKHENYIQLEVKTFTDSSKSVLITSNIYTLDGGEEISAVIDKDLSTPPGSPSVDDMYIVGSSATGDWTGKEDEIATWNGSTWGFSSDTVRYVTDESKYYRHDGTNWTEDANAFDSRVWNNYFTIDKIGGVDTTDADIIRRAYEYLKTRTEFAGVSDS